MKPIRSVAVFCGASNGVSKDYLEVARDVGTKIAKRDIHLVYGGGRSGMMGAVASGCLDGGGKVTGVFPSVLEGLEPQHEGLTELIQVLDMHTRKMTMFERSDAFIVLPGGFGTMDETFEVITWKQLNTHIKPIVILNQNGYFDSWVHMTDHFIANGFASFKTRKLYEVVNEVEDIFQIIH